MQGGRAWEQQVDVQKELCRILNLRIDGCLELERLELVADASHSLCQLGLTGWLHSIASLQTVWYL